VLQERARFRRLYPPMKGSYDPHYHWRGAREERHQLDHILSRLVDVRVRPVKQPTQCSCTFQSPPVQRQYTANNSVDTALPYNPWYGSYTEHMLQTLSIDDADPVQRIRPVTIAAARLHVHVEEERGNEDGRDQQTSAETLQDEPTLDELEERDLNLANTREEGDSTATLETSEQTQSVHGSSTAVENGSSASGYQRSELAKPQQETTTSVKDTTVTQESSKSVSVVEISAETVGKNSVVTVEQGKSVITTLKLDNSPKYNNQIKYSLEEQQQVEEKQLAAAKDPPNLKQSVSRNHNVSIRYQDQPSNISTTEEGRVAERIFTTQAESTEKKVSLSALIDMLLKIPPLSRRQKTSAVESTKENAGDEDGVNDGGAETNSTSAADVEEETSKTPAVPDVSVNNYELMRSSVDDQDLTMVIPDVSDGANSSPRETVEDREVSAFMADIERQPEVIGTRPQLVDTQTRNTADKRDAPNSDEQSNQQEDVPETQQGQKERDGQKNDHKSKLSESASNQAIAIEDLQFSLLNGNSMDMPEVAEKDRMHQKEPEGPPDRENAQEIENETKPETTKPERPGTVVPIPLPRTSVKSSPSKSLLLLDNNETDGNISDMQISIETLSVMNGEDDRQVGTDSFVVDNEFGFRRTDSEEVMDVDEEVVWETGEDEPKAIDAQRKGEERSEEVTASGADWRIPVDAEANSNFHQQQPRESSVEQTTLNESRRTVSLSETTNAGSVSTLLAPTAPDPDHDTDVSSRKDVGKFPDHVSTTVISPPDLSDRDTSSVANQPTWDGTRAVPHGERTRENVNRKQLESSTEDVDTSEPDYKFPKSSTGHKVSTQQDRRAKRLAKTIRIYHDLSTFSAEYQENGNTAVTTIHLKSARNR